jgi:hypothetical protein
MCDLNQFMDAHDGASDEQPFSLPFRWARAEPVFNTLQPYTLLVRQTVIGSSRVIARCQIACMLNMLCPVFSEHVHGIYEDFDNLFSNQTAQRNLPTMF